MSQIPSEDSVNSKQLQPPNRAKKVNEIKKLAFGSTLSVPVVNNNKKPQSKKQLQNEEEEKKEETTEEENDASSDIERQR